MAKILLLASGALLLFSTLLGFRNMGRLSEQQTVVKQARETADASAKRADKAGKDLKASQTQLETANKNATELQDKLAAATSEADRLKREADDNARKVGDAQGELDRVRAQAAQSPGVGGAMADTSVELQNKIRELETQVAEAKQVQRSMQEQVRTADANVRELRVKEDRRQRGLMASGLSGNILAVDRNWNFVVLNLGDRNGVVHNAEMIVQRGGAMVGKVRITSVEPSQSIADIIPNSVPAGIVVERGDRVIYAGGDPAPPGAARR